MVHEAYKTSPTMTVVQVLRHVANRFVMLPCMSCVLLPRATYHEDNILLL